MAALLGCFRLTANPICDYHEFGVNRMAWTSLVAAAIASGTALWVAYRVYPFHKEQDRQLQLLSERRAAYKEFFDIASDYRAALQTAFFASDPASAVLQQGSKEYADICKAQETLAGYASKEVLEQCFRYVDCLHIYRGHLNHDLNHKRLSYKAAQVEDLQEAYRYLQEARVRAIALARSDVFACSLEDAQADLSGIFDLEDKGSVT